MLHYYTPIRVTITNIIHAWLDDESEDEEHWTHKEQTQEDEQEQPQHTKQHTIHILSLQPIVHHICMPVNDKVADLAWTHVST